MLLHDFCNAQHVIALQSELPKSHQCWANCHHDYSTDQKLLLMDANEG